MVAGTRIALANGEFCPIEKVTLGTLVITYNLSDDTLSESAVTNIFVYEPKEVVTIKFKADAGQTILYNQVICTTDHPLYARNKGWVAVFPSQLLPEGTTHDLPKPPLQLVIGDVLLGLHGDVKVDEILYEGNICPVFDISVGSTHCYYANGILAHNLQIFVKTESGQIFEFEEGSTGCLDSLMEKVAQKTGVPVRQQRLILNGKEPHNLSEIPNSSTLILENKAASLKKAAGATTLHGHSEQVFGSSVKFSGNEKQTFVGEVRLVANATENIEAKPAKSWSDECIPLHKAGAAQDEI